MVRILAELVRFLDSMFRSRSDAYIGWLEEQIARAREDLMQVEAGVKPRSRSRAAIKARETKGVLERQIADLERDLAEEVSRRSMPRQSALSAILKRFLASRDKASGVGDIHPTQRPPRCAGGSTCAGDTSSLAFHATREFPATVKSAKATSPAHGLPTTLSGQ